MFDDQLACADMVVINKTDLLTEAGNAAVTATLGAETRAPVRFVKTAMGVLPANALLGQKIGAKADLATRAETHHHHQDADDAGDHHHHAHGHDEFETFIVTRPEIAAPAAFARHITEIIRRHDILRLTVQAVGPREDTCFDRPLAPGEARETRLVVIGETGLDRAAIEAAPSA